MKTFHNSIPIYIFSVVVFCIHMQIPLLKRKKKCGCLTEQMHALYLLWQLDSLKELCPKKRKHNAEAFILEMKRIMVPLVNVLNTISKLYALEKVKIKDLFYQCIDFFFFVASLSFSMWCPPLILFCSSCVQVSCLFYYQNIKCTKQHQTY